MSKNPLELSPGRKLSREEIAEALRLAIIAELDAINLYLQLARAIDDEKIRRVFEDISREEKTHVGEFLALLKTLDPGQTEELRRGSEEVRALTGLETRDPVSSNDRDIWRGVSENIARVVDSLRVFRKHIPLTRVGRGIDAVPLETSQGVRRVLSLDEISVVFRVSQRTIDYIEKSGLFTELGEGYRAAVEFAVHEDRYVLDRLTGLSDAVRIDIGAWDMPGEALTDIAKAVSKMIEGGAREPFVVFMSPARYVKLLAVHEKTGVMELTRVKGLVKEVVAVPIIPDDTVVIVSANLQVIDMVVGADTQIDYLGPEDGFHKLRIWETLALRPRLERGVAVLRQRGT